MASVSHKIILVLLVIIVGWLLVDRCRCEERYTSTKNTKASDTERRDSICFSNGVCLQAVGENSIKLNGNLEVTNSADFGTSTGRKVQINAEIDKNEQTYISFFKDNNTKRTAYILPVTNGDLNLVSDMGKVNAPRAGQITADKVCFNFPNKPANNICISQPTANRIVFNSGGSSRKFAIGGWSGVNTEWGTPWTLPQGY